MNLVVIEGIGKLETVQKYLGAGYKVFATRGHIRDLPPNRLAVDVKNDFEPTYAIIADKKEVVESLKKAAKSAEKVLLATDPDREGEAISWHVANILEIPENSPVRIEFNEISKNAIQSALKSPRPIDKNLVDAQQARRVLDRLVGYMVSPILSKKIQSKLSAGRVQSVTLRLVVDREREIMAFKPEEYWTFFSRLKTAKGATVKAALTAKLDKKIKLTSAKEVEEVKADLNGKPYTVASVKKSVTKTHPYAPFITSTMQQEALNKLGMSLKQTSAAAQALYEGVDLPGEGKVALITYIRTDSTRVSAQAISSAREYIGGLYGDKCVPEKPNYFATKKSAQDAHEAIRPISVERTPESVKAHLEPRLYKLYDLIYKRFLASQMADATYNSVSVDISAGDYTFHLSGRTPLFDGYLRAYNFAEKRAADDDKEDENVLLPELTVGEQLEFIEYVCDQKFTKPPARYTEASLVKAMEEKGIGRPATYTPTVSILFTRRYVSKDGKSIVPTELGFEVNDMLMRYFTDIMDVGFTAQMESELDNIEECGVRWQTIIEQFYNGGFEEKVKAAKGDSFTLKQPDEPTEIVCEKCGANMVIKSGKYGKFLACPNYPKCKNSKPLDENGKIKEPEVSDVICEKCGGKMVVKHGRFGEFLGCSNYPECKNIINLKKPEEKELPPCPKCGKPLKTVRTPRSTFYGCTGYPDCDFTLSARPTGEKCPKCSALLVERTSKTGTVIKCSSRSCDYTKDAIKE